MVRPVSIYNAERILELLAIKHSKDVFIPECKDGPTYFSSHLRVDAWAMNRSWAHPAATAYEIKVTRSDFLSDNKWHGYLPLCNQFYFVSPPNMIDVSELPPEAGLMTVAGTSRLITKKKAPHRSIQLPEELYRYILMCRTVVSRSEYQVEKSHEERVIEWRQFVDKKVEHRELGRQVSRAIREKADSFKIENERLKKRMEEYDEIRKFLSAMGINPADHVSRWAVEDRIKEQENLFPREFVWAMRNLRESLDRALTQIELTDVKAIAS